MRNAFIRALENYPRSDALLIVGDLGFGVFDGFQENHPNRFINAGVAEQNMTGLAAGLALSGKKVFTYSIANFTTIRPLEQIRNDIAYHDLNVTMVCAGGGLAYGALGFSHHALEDLAIMRALPNLTVLAPGDTKEAYELTRQLILRDWGPTYLRLGRAGEPTLHSEESTSNLRIGRALPLVESPEADIAILTTGGMLQVGAEVRDMLLRYDLESSVYSFHTIKPFDQGAVRNIFRNYRYVISLEEHSVIGGFGSAILESLIGEPRVHLDRYLQLGLPSDCLTRVGDQEYLRDSYGISPKRIMIKLKHFIQRRDKWKVA